MIRTTLTLILFSLPLTPFATAGDLYFQKDSTIIRWSLDHNTLDTVWYAPFMIQDVSISQDCHFICFTKSAVGDETRPERVVGYYSLLEGKFTIIKSNTLFNYGAVISPSNNFIAFSYLPEHEEWKTAIYDRTKDTIHYDVAPTMVGDTYNVFGWRSDSLLLFATLNEIIEYDLYDSSDRVFTAPDTNMSFSVPGTQMVFLNDSALAIMCGDDGRYLFDEFEGSPGNVFIITDRKAVRLFTNKESVNTCFLYKGSLYIGYTDYARSKKGKDMLMRYDVVNGQKKILKPIGTLVGVSGD